MPLLPGFRARAQFRSGRLSPNRTGRQASSKLSIWPKETPASEMSEKKLQDELCNIPLADDDPQAVIQENEGPDGERGIEKGQSMESLHSSGTNDSISQQAELECTADEIEEKARLISQVLELQNTLDDLSLRVDSVKEENLKLRSENQVLGQYIENLMSASSVFQSTSPKSKKK